MGKGEKEKYQAGAVAVVLSNRPCPVINKLLCRLICKIPSSAAAAAVSTYHMAGGPSPFSYAGYMPKYVTTLFFITLPTIHNCDVARIDIINERAVLGKETSGGEGGPLARPFCQAKPSCGFAPDSRSQRREGGNARPPIGRLAVHYP